MNLKYTAKEADVNKTIKEILLSYFHISHRLLITLKKENCILLNNIPTFIYKTIQLGDIITVSFDYVEDNSNIIPKHMDLQIIYEDDWLLVVNKPAGIPVHPSILHYEDSLSNGIKFYFDTINLRKKIRPVIRIDKDTSGIVVFAKCEYIQEALIKQMENNTFKKEYIAIVEGYFDNIKGTIDEPISRKNESIIEREVNTNGDKSVTHYEVLRQLEKNNTKISVVKCTLETGRTHQIRVHMSYINHPLLGDDLYGGNLNIIKRQALHCKKVTFIHPITNNIISLETELSNDLKAIF